MIVRLEIDGNLLSEVEAAARAQGIDFKEFVHTALRNAVSHAQFITPAPFSQKVHDFGLHLESPWTLLADLETNAAVMRK